MSNLFKIRLNRNIEFKSEEKEGKKPRAICIRIPNKFREELEEIKGDGTWLNLLLDGAKHRGRTFDVTPHNRERYKNHYYCSHCVKWIPHEEGVYKVARAFVRCPTCMLPLRTRGLESNSKNWTEWDEEE